MLSEQKRYNVKIYIGETPVIQQVYARSDYEAALKVRRETGYMARSDNDVTMDFIF